MSLGLPEIILILVVALLFFGPSRLPSLGKSVGEAIRGFKKGISGISEDENEKLSHSGRNSDADDISNQSTNESSLKKEKSKV